MPNKAEMLLSGYTDAIHDSAAAIFVGAGLSRPAGMLDWKELLRSCALELGLDVEREHDLVALAQYSLNHRLRDRSHLNKIIQDAFDKPGVLTENHEIITRLPIDTVWTTNYDSVLEDAYKKAGKVVDVKTTDKSIGRTKQGREVTVYKMHGDVARPEEVVICKDDYERYARKHEVFQNSLQGDLVNKTFLFLGFSFADPHLSYMLGHLRALLEDSKRLHYAILRRVNRADFPSGKDGDDEFIYEHNKQSLQTQDLLRYSIETLLIDDYGEVTQVLHAIERCYYARNILVSGSASDYGTFGEARMLDFCRQLGRQLMAEGYNLVSGFGLGIASAVLTGAMEWLYEKDASKIDRRLLLRPFPQIGSSSKPRGLQQRHRKQMIEKCGTAIFIAGNKPGMAVADGVLKEYELAKTAKKGLIPIGATGFAAHEIWVKVERSFRTTYEGKVQKTIYDQLNASGATDDELLDAVSKMLKHLM